MEEITLVLLLMMLDLVVILSPSMVSYVVRITHVSILLCVCEKL